MKSWHYRLTRDSNIVMKLLRITIIVLLFLIIFAYINNLYFIKVVEREIQASNKKELASIVNMTHDTMESIKRIMYQYTYDRSIVSLSYTKKYDADTYMKLVNVRSNIRSFKNARSDIHDIFIRFKQSEFVLGTEGLMSTRVFYEKLDEESKRTVRSMSEDRTNQGKVMLQPISYMSAQANMYLYSLRDMAIYVVTDREAENRAIESATSRDDTKVLVLDRELNIVSGTEHDLRFVSKPASLDEVVDILERRSTDSLYTFLTSSSDHFHFIIGHTDSVAAQKNQQINNYTVLLLTVFMVFCLLLFMLMNAEVYRPLRNVLGKLNIGGQGSAWVTNEYALLDQAISSLQEELHSVGGYLKKHEKLVQESFLNKLMLGHELDHELKNMLYAAETRQHYLVVTVILEDGEGHHAVGAVRQFEYLLGSSFTFTTINMYAKERTYFVQVDPAVEVAAALIEKLKVWHAPGLFMIMGVSNLYTELDDLREAYEESRSVFHRQQVMQLDEGGWSIGFATVDDDLQEEGSFDLNIQEEKQLMMLVTSGDAEAIPRLLTKLWAKNKSKSIFRQHEMHYYLLNLYVIMLNSREGQRDEGSQQQISAFIRYYRDIFNVSLMNRLLIERFVDLSGQYADEKTNLKQIIIDYIEQNYMHDVYLDRVADEVKLSYTYVSHYFKKATGMNFIDYVRQVRVEKAKLLLTEQNLSVNETALSVGFESANTFIRTFKKIVGITPGEFRKLAHELGEPMK
ncbi:helix-turn-helix transcriptional regulator [Paenibacillus spongiae]|uniref:AraC family transcriptional regulator n=1 Tax=Paenibacillus spongiae TaxID=2909671 RepID=A0ABY5S122_9BACL|nr:helix-turn-helix domain-containing protein [Paenibacillus spongiae]UVI27349.1 AraC family transcriptional regulator [Paenibacillus spongiae]